MSEQPATPLASSQSESEQKAELKRIADYLISLHGELSEKRGHDSVIANYCWQAKYFVHKVMNRIEVTP